MSTGPPSAPRRLVRALRWGLLHRVLTLLAPRPGRRRLSAMVRVKNEEEFLYPSVKSIADDVDEIVLIDNLSSDRTPEIIEALHREYAGKVVTLRYPWAIHPRGTNHHFVGRPGARDSPHLSASYYNWCLRRCRGPFILKWDGDMIATGSFRDALASWRTSTTLLLRVTGANVHPDREHLVAFKPTEADGTFRLPGLPVTPTSLRSPTYVTRDVRLFPKRFAAYRMDEWSQVLLSPCLLSPRGAASIRDVPDVSYLHLKFCRRDAFADFSPRVARVVSAALVTGPLLQPGWHDLLRRWRVACPA